MKKLLEKIEVVRFIKFSVVGAVGVVVNTIALYLLTTFVFGERLYMAAAAISLELSIINNFFLNEYWTFKDRAVSGEFFKRFFKFHGSRLAGFFTTLVILYILTDIAGIYYLISNLIAVLVGTAVNYLTSNYWVWQ
ncbi:MAG: GtrA family protein [Candidatus Caldarchaeum sp.]|nr:GtrA family protein [Candidatus Caldarchaeum sp.]